MSAKAQKLAKNAAKPSAAPNGGLSYPYPKNPKPGEVREIADGIFWLRMPLPFGLDHINLWALEEEESWSVVDTGTNTPEIRAIWDSFWKNRGKGKPVRRVVVTHLHPDHVGLAGWMCRKWDADLWMSRTDYLMCRTLVGDTGRTAPQEALRFYQAAGFVDKHILAYMKAFGGFGRFVSEMPNAYNRLQDGDRIPLGRRDWEVVVGRGHAPEHICLYAAEEDLFITGDQVLPRITSNISVFPTEPNANPLSEWLASCRHLKERVPDSVLALPAHNEPFRGLHRRLDDLLENHETALARLQEMCREPKRAIDVFPALFRRKVDGSLTIMAVGESIAHLNYLRASGVMDVTSDADGVFWYQSSDGAAARLDAGTKNGGKA